MSKGPGFSRGSYFLRSKKSAASQFNLDPSRCGGGVNALRSGEVKAA